jgi:hypothetical protein
MKRPVVVIWMLAALAALGTAGGALWLSGWRPNFDDSIELSDSFGKVENGSAYDRAAVDLGDAKKLILPHDAAVRRVREPGEVVYFMKKTLSFHGHPPEPMSVRDARKHMGCAVKREGDDLLLATFGEWDSHIEGGAHVKLVVYVPDGIDVEQRKGLSGGNSAARKWDGQYLTKPKDAKGGYWYGPASPSDGWAAVPDVPDPGRTAR